MLACLVSWTLARFSLCETVAALSKMILYWSVLLSKGLKNPTYTLQIPITSNAETWSAGTVSAFNTRQKHRRSS